jgi:hypothetical protein
MMSRGKRILELALAITAKENINLAEKEEDSHHSWSDDSEFYNYTDQAMVHDI